MNWRRNSKFRKKISKDKDKIIFALESKTTDVQEKSMK